MFYRCKKQAKDSFGDEMPNYEQQIRKKKIFNNERNVPEIIFHGD